MVVNGFFITLVLILFSARFLGEFVARFKIPSVIGELLAGIILGPSLLNLIQPTEVISLLAEIGIVLLLFEVGLETDIYKILKIGSSAFIAASVGVAAPLILGFFAAYYFFDLDLLSALFIGGTLTATSIGITLRVLSDLKKKEAAESQIVLGASIIDDIIGVVLLALLYEFATTGEINWFEGERILLFIIIFMITSPILAKIISSIIKYYDETSEIPGLLPCAIVSLLLLFAWLAHQLGAPELLGGFAAGLALSKSFLIPLPSFLQTSKKFSERVDKQMKPIIHIFTPIFFVNIGLNLNLQAVAWSSSFVWAASGLLLLAAIIGKLASGLVLYKKSLFIRSAVGIAMIPRGEVGLIFAEIGRNSNVFDNELYATMVIVIAITTLIAPVGLRYFYSRYPTSAVSKKR